MGYSGAGGGELIHEKNQKQKILCPTVPLIRNLGSQTHIFKSLITIFGVKSTTILCKLAQIFFFTSSKIK